MNVNGNIKNLVKIFIDLYRIYKVNLVLIYGDSIMSNIVRTMKPVIGKDDNDNIKIRCVMNEEISNNEWKKIKKDMDITEQIEYFKNKSCNGYNRCNKRNIPDLCLFNPLADYELHHNRYVIWNNYEKADVLITNFELVHHLWHNTINEIEEYLKEQLVKYDNLLSVLYGNNTDNWPIMIVLELPLIISKNIINSTESIESE